MATKRPDPPSRPAWIRMMKPAQQATALLREYLEIRMGCEDKEESTLCRSFLRAYAKVTERGNPVGIELAIRTTGKHDTIAIFHVIPGTGAITWLPVIIMKLSDRLKHIIRETGDRIYPFEPEPKPFDPWDEKTPGRGIPPKVETLMFRGRKV